MGKPKTGFCHTLMVVIAMIIKEDQTTTYLLPRYLGRRREADLGRNRNEADARSQGKANEK